MSEFIFIRHGESTGNAEGFIGTPTTPLSKKGREQAKLTAKKLQGSGIKTIVASPFVRTQETARIIAEEIGINASEIRTMEELQERRGPAIEGKPKDQANDWYLLNDDPREEPRPELLKRMHKALVKLKKLADYEGPLLVVGHAVSGYFLLQAAEGKKSVKDLDTPTQMKTAELIKVRFK